MFYKCLFLRTVGPGGSPDENGETTIDAMVMNGVTMEVGAVAAMRYVSDGIKTARLVMQHTEHTLLVGEQASRLAIYMGLPGHTNLSSEESIVASQIFGKMSYHFGLHNHDTIAMAVIDKKRLIAVGTSTNGATFKIPGSNPTLPMHFGDGPIAGSSAYADTDVGACGASGDGDIMMRFLPCYQVVESLRLGMEPKLAAEDAIARKYPDFVGGVFAVDKNGIHAGACHGWIFQYSVRSPDMADVVVYTINPVKSTA
ncbi:hypothetical protein SASPL_107293 [Salvia splendens]|uniref:beta-aspartyl-peptidase n=1 Tax=Salvia splendens TaxID=180675 RepID=A0A8X8YB37_SALSN|nr:hypothetical protein SASPL_107293 [Salvia splendens]